MLGWRTLSGLKDRECGCSPSSLELDSGDETQAGFVGVCGGSDSVSEPPEESFDWLENCASPSLESDGEAPPPENVPGGGEGCGS